MMENMTIVLASRNKGKLAELQRLLRACLGDGIELRSLDEVGITGEIEENGKTFAENAEIKARAASAAGYPGLGDDSGLTVRALGGAPGIYSARYAGEHGDDAANNALLLRNLEGESDRAAAFVCALAIAYPDGRVLHVQGDVQGEILTHAQGDGGFGYDPLFYYPPMKKTLAQMSADEKNEISHRGAAVRALCERLIKEN